MKIRSEKVTYFHYDKVSTPHWVVVSFLLTSQGEEIYNTYGKISNYTLLLMYGFCVKPLSNPYNTTELRLPALRQACEQTGFPDAALRFDWLDKKVSQNLKISCRYPITVFPVCFFWSILELLLLSKYF